MSNWRTACSPGDICSVMRDGRLLPPAYLYTTSVIFEPVGRRSSPPEGATSLRWATSPTLPRLRSVYRRPTAASYPLTCGTDAGNTPARCPLGPTNCVRQRRRLRRSCGGEQLPHYYRYGAPTCSNRSGNPPTLTNISSDSLISVESRVTAAIPLTTPWPRGIGSGPPAAVVGGCPPGDVVPVWSSCRHVRETTGRAARPAGQPAASRSRYGSRRNEFHRSTDGESNR